MCENVEQHVLELFPSIQCACVGVLTVPIKPTKWQFRHFFHFPSFLDCVLFGLVRFSSFSTFLLCIILESANFRHSTSVSGHFATSSLEKLNFSVSFFSTNSVCTQSQYQYGSPFGFPCIFIKLIQPSAITLTIYGK